MLTSCWTVLPTVVWENAGRPFDELMADNRRKLAKDWNRRIVLPEAAAAFESRYRFLLEQTGTIPKRFIP
jgi:hypothetical protein